MYFTYLTGFCTLVLATTVLGQSGTDLKNLKTKLFTTDNYNSKVRPVTDQSNPVQVTMVISKIFQCNAVSRNTKGI